MEAIRGSEPEAVSPALELLVRVLPRDTLLTLLGLLLEQEHLSFGSRDALTCAILMRHPVDEGNVENDREALLNCVRRLPPDEQRSVTLAVLEAVAFPEP
jgi:hypothetical protein